MMKDACQQPANTYACSSVVGAWSGGAYDEKRDRMLVFGGGHADSWYNNVFSFDLVSMKWSRLTEMPEGASSTPPAAWKDSRLETCGYYPKGAVNLPADVMKGSYVDPAKCFVEPVVSQLDFQQPRSTHSYGTFFVDHVRDRYCSFSDGSFYPSAQSQTSVTNCLDPVTLKWSRAADLPTKVGARGSISLDAAGNAWSVPGQGGYIGKYDPTTDSWTTYGYSNYDSRGGADVDRKRHQLHVLYPSLGNPYTVRRWNLAAPLSLTATPTYNVMSTTGDAPVTQADQRPGFVYADKLDRFYAWNGGRDMYSLDPLTGVWTRLSATGDDPGAQQTTGTFGRFRYVPSRGVFVLVNDANKNVYIYKPAN